MRVTVQASPIPSIPSPPGDRAAATPVGGVDSPDARPGAWVFYQRRQFIVKSVLLALTTVALIPVLLLKDTPLAMVYIVALVLVHVIGIALVAIGVKRHQLAPDRRGLVIRLVGIAILLALLSLAAKGLTTDLTSFVFWGVLFAIWALHTAGLALLHFRSRREQSVCPFI